MHEETQMLLETYLASNKHDAELAETADEYNHKVVGKLLRAWRRDFNLAKEGSPKSKLDITNWMKAYNLEVADIKRRMEDGASNKAKKGKSSLKTAPAGPVFNTQRFHAFRNMKLMYFLTMAMQLPIELRASEVLGTKTLTEDVNGELAGVSAIKSEYCIRE